MRVGVLAGQVRAQRLHVYEPVADSAPVPVARQLSRVLVEEDAVEPGLATALDDLDREHVTGEGGERSMAVGEWGRGGDGAPHARREQRVADRGARVGGEAVERRRGDGEVAQAAPPREAPPGGPRLGGCFGCGGAS